MLDHILASESGVSQIFLVIGTFLAVTRSTCLVLARASFLQAAIC